MFMNIYLLFIYIFFGFSKSQRPSGCESTTTAIAGHRNEGGRRSSYSTLFLPSLNFFLELASFERLTELPVPRNGVVASDGTAVAGRHLEREALSVQIIVALPILSPIP